MDVTEPNAPYRNISLYTRSIFCEQEIEEVAVVKESLATANDEREYRTRYFNLEVIVESSSLIPYRREA